MAEYERVPETRSSGTGSTAIVAIVVIILLAVVAFFVFLRPGTDVNQQPEGPDIELEVEPPATGGGGDAPAEIEPSE